MRSPASASCCDPECPRASWSLGFRVLSPCARALHFSQLTLTLSQLAQYSALILDSRDVRSSEAVDDLEQAQLFFAHTCSCTALTSAAALPDFSPFQPASESAIRLAKQLEADAQLAEFEFDKALCDSSSQERD